MEFTKLSAGCWGCEIVRCSSWRWCGASWQSFFLGMLRILYGRLKLSEPFVSDLCWLFAFECPLDCSFPVCLLSPFVFGYWSSWTCLVEETRLPFLCLFFTTATPSFLKGCSLCRRACVHVESGAAKNLLKCFAALAFASIEPYCVH